MTLLHSIQQPRSGDQKLSQRQKRWGCSRSLLIYTCVIILCLLAVLPQSLAQSEDYDDLMNEVLEEDERDDDYDNPYFDDSKYGDPQELKRQQEEQEMAQKKAAEEQLARERAEQRKRERDAQFEADLARMDEGKRKAAKRQRKKDAVVVKRVLKAAHKEDHYAVLGIRNREFQIPSRTFSLAKKRLFTLPGFTLFHLSPSMIKKAYRNRALSVHPDKNRDGRAEEAFVAVENSASILTDATLRKEYDETLRQTRSKQRQYARKVVQDSADKAFGTARGIWTLFTRVLGPFSVPTLILGVVFV